MNPYIIKVQKEYNNTLKLLFDKCDNLDNIITYNKNCKFFDEESLYVLYTNNLKKDHKQICKILQKYNIGFDIIFYFHSPTLLEPYTKQRIIRWFPNEKYSLVKS